MEYEKVVVKPTWQLAWGMWWRLFLINLGIGAVIAGIFMAIFFVLGVTLWPSWEEWVPTVMSMIP